MPLSNARSKQILNGIINNIGVAARDHSQPECFIPKRADNKKYDGYGFCSWCKETADHGYWLYGDIKRPVCIECAENLLPATASEVVGKIPVESSCSPQLCARVRDPKDANICQRCEGGTAAEKSHYIRALNKRKEWVDVVVCVNCWKIAGTLV